MYLRHTFYKCQQENTNLYRKWCDKNKEQRTFNRTVRKYIRLVAIYKTVRKNIRLSNCHVSLLKMGFDALCRFYD